MVVTKDRPHGPGRSEPMFIVVECEDHLAIQAPPKNDEMIYIVVYGSLELMGSIPLATNHYQDHLYDP